MIEKLRFIFFLHKTRKDMLKSNLYVILPEEKNKKPKYHHINNGYCGIFSSRVYKKFGDDKVQVYGAGLCIHDCGINVNTDLPDHYFIKYNNKFYDSECIFGVSDYLNLPLFKFTPKKV